MKRQEQKIENTWNMQDLYATEELYARDGEMLNEKLQEFAAYQGTLAQGEEQAAKALESYGDLNHMFERMYVYAFQKYHEDTGNAKYQKMSGEMDIMAVKLGQAVSWLEPELLKLPEETLQKYLASEKLSEYRRFMERIARKREHVLDAEMEALMSRIGELGQAPSTIYSMFDNADLRFPDAADENGTMHPLTHASYIPYQESKDRTLRKNAFESLYHTYAQFKNTMASTYYANAKQADFFAKERRYRNAMEASLAEGAIPVDVYKNLIETIGAALPQMHRYVRLRKKLLGLSELHMYDVYTPMVDRPEKTYTFEEAKKIVKRGLAPLGEDYLAILQEGFDNRWIDVYENEGKRSGAYSWSAYGTHPYVLMNYNGTLDNVFTLAHEMGHALHSWYSMHNQNYLNAGYLIFVAEVASTCNEAILIHDLMNRTEDAVEKSYLINHFLDQFKGTMFRQTMFAEFEMLTHEVVEKGGMLTAEQICGIYKSLNEKYYGPDMISDPEIAYEWERIPHFYTPFYVYQYATGFAAAIAISSKILAGEPGIVEKYKQFLSGGGSMDPIDLLKICGVDMSSPEPVKAALHVFAEYLDLLESQMQDVQLS